jgi:DNA-binding response OmpR family regulator
MSNIPVVLIVEDDAATGHLLEALVRRNHFRPMLAGDGKAAVGHLESTDFDVILLDLILPGIDGWEILRRLSLATPHLLQRIILVTAAPEAMYREHDAMSRAWCLVRKPFELSLLEGQMLECCAERRRDAARIAVT